MDVISKLYLKPEIQVLAGYHFIYNIYSQP